MRLKLFISLSFALLGLVGYVAWLERGFVWCRVTDVTLTINGQAQENPKIYSQGANQLLVIVPGHHPSLGDIENPFVVDFKNNSIRVPNWGATHEFGRLFIAPDPELAGVNLRSAKFDSVYPYSVSNDRIEFVDQLSDEYRKIEITLTPRN